jgi:hypothetical protein
MGMASCSLLHSDHVPEDNNPNTYRRGNLKCQENHIINQVIYKILYYK